MAIPIIDEGDPVVIVPFNDPVIEMTEALPVDCTISLDSQDAAEPTRLPVEAGVDITDHVRVAPTRITLNVLQTNTSIDFLEGSPIRDASRSQDFREQLLEWRDARKVLAVITAKRIFVNMVITQIDENQVADNAEAYSASLSMEEIIKVDSELVSLSGTATAPAGNRSKLGKKSSKPAKRTVRASALSALGRWLGGN
jgi:hypothetical protein